VTYRLDVTYRLTTIAPLDPAGEALDTYEIQFSDQGTASVTFRPGSTQLNPFDRKAASNKEPSIMCKILSLISMLAVILLASSSVQAERTTQRCGERLMEMMDYVCESFTPVIAHKKRSMRKFLTRKSGLSSN